MKDLRLNLSSDSPTLEITSESNESLFNDIAHYLESAFKGKWATKINGLDQRYWDLEIGPTLLTLHLEHYLGISLFPTNKADVVESLRLLQKAHELLASYNPQ